MTASIGYLLRFIGSQSFFSLMTASQLFFCLQDRLSARMDSGSSTGVLSEVVFGRRNKNLGLLWKRTTVEFTVARNGVALMQDYKV